MSRFLFRPKWRCLAIKHSATMAKTQTKTNTAYQHKDLILAVKHGGVGVMIWACFAAKRPGHLAVFESTINSSPKVF